MTVGIDNAKINLIWVLLRIFVTKMNILEELYLSQYHQHPDNMNLITGSASSRRYYRLTGNTDVIGTIGNDKRENDAFVYRSNTLSKANLNVPRVIVVSPDGMSYLQEDLGNDSLLSIIQKNGEEKSIDILLDTIELLVDFNYRGSERVDTSRCFPREAMDRRSVMWDLNYFKYCFLKPWSINFDEDRLEDAFEEFADDIVYNPEGTLMARDFQSRNILIHNSQPYLIDFQGARKGTGLYDLASLLWQSRLNLSESIRTKLAAHYREKARLYLGKDIADFEQRLAKQALFRVMQVLGAYGFRGLVDGNSQFITPIAKSLEYLENLSEKAQVNQYLLAVLKEAASHHHIIPTSSESLTIKVMSFSYKKGIPKDWSGNGGGFVFDCRALPNPGRYEEYKRYTGLDKPVIDYLENDGEILRFIKECEALVDRAVEKYLSRGFTSLMVCFGCTGGQHRSVYAAQQMAMHIAKRKGVTVDLWHREQNIKSIIHTS